MNVNVAATMLQQHVAISDLGAKMFIPEISALLRLILFFFSFSFSFFYIYIYVMQYKHVQL